MNVDPQTLQLMNIVMMKITMQDAIMMEELVAIKTWQDGMNSAQIVNVWILRAHRLVEAVVPRILQMTIIAMMKITMQDVIMMEELAAIKTLLDGMNFALIVNV